MLQLDNKTPFVAGFGVMPNEQGVDTLFLMVKATFNIGEKWTLADTQYPIQKADQYWDTPENSSISLPSDYHLNKPTSDIMIIGEAVAMDEKPVQALNVDVQIGSLSKHLRVFGQRWWDRQTISTPDYFTHMPVTYEHAFGGGEYLDDKRISAYPHNPVGLGWRGPKKDRPYADMPLPNVEHRQQLINSPEDVPQPAGLTAIAPFWLPRAALAGTYDETWQNTRAPYLPLDYQPAFQNCASPGLIYPNYLQGGEPLTITGMHAEGPVKCQLPQIKLAAFVTTKHQSLTLQFNWATLLVEPNLKRLCATWRADLICDKQLLNIQTLTLKLMRD